jgi:hypothetical protein
VTSFARFVGLDARRGDRDDRVLPATRWLGRILVPALAVAAVILYGFLDRTTELFAWTIRPNMTPIMMGAGYATGAYFFYRVVTTDHWHRVALVFPGIAVFTWFMGLATVLHWANFNHSHPSFAIWAFLYAVAPFLVPAVWYLNRHTDPRDPADVRLPRVVRWASGASGLIITLTAALLFVVPEALIAVWPWTVSPLTARILLGWFALFGVVNLAVAFDPRWSAVRLPVQTELIGFGLVLLGAGLAWDDFDTANPLTWGFVGGFGLYLPALLALYAVMERR